MFKSIIKGKFAEFMTNLTFSVVLDKKIYTLHKNVTLEIEEDTTQIDHIIISKYGIIVIETKDYKGWIIGKKHEKQWTQQIYKKRYKFQNPLHQNYKHIKFLQKTLSIPDVMELEENDFISIIFFTGMKAELKSKLPDNVMTSGLLAYIKEQEEIKLSDIKIKKLNERLKDKKLKSSFKTDRLHVENVKKIIKNKEDKIKIPVEKVVKKPEYNKPNNFKKLSTSKLAVKLKMKTDELHKKFIKLGYLEVKDSKEQLTAKGKEVGGELKNFRNKDYFAWKEDTPIT